MTSTTTLPETGQIADLATRLRRDSIRATTSAGSGHPTSSMSAADVAAVLFSRHFRFDVDRPGRLDNDRFVLSKGHASPLVYAVLAAFGLIEAEELDTLRAAGSRLEGHPVPSVPLVDVATGSLGQGLSCGLGMALGQRILGQSARSWVLLGDSEMAEGAVWEAVELAGHLGVSNLAAIVDLNRLGQRGPTMHEWDAAPHLERARALGWEPIEVDGHDLEAVDHALSAASRSGRPTLVVARTVKGKGVSFVEDVVERHGKPFAEDEASRALAELGEVSETTWSFAGSPEGDPTSEPSPPRADWERPRFEEETPTRNAFGAALEARSRVDERLVALDGEVSDSTRTGLARDALGNRFVEAFIAEQNMVGMAAGMQALDLHPVAASFGAFLTRAHDFIRMAGIGRARMTLVGSHAGVAIGADGPSQMGLEDIAMMRAAEVLVLYPADATSAVALVDLAVEHDGISYLRTTRGATPALYPAGTGFRVGGSHVHGAGDDDRAAIVAAGVTLFEALDAAEELRRRGIPVRVVDAYSVDPIDRPTLLECLASTGTMLVVEDHRRAGGIGEAVRSAVSEAESGRVLSLAVEGTPGSASPREQLQWAGIDADSITETLVEVLG